MTRLYRLLLSSAFLLMLVPAGIGSQNPPIRWSQNRIERLMSPGLTLQENLSFSSALTFKGVQVEVVPELKGFVSVSPSSFTEVSAGKSYGISLLFSVPNT